MFPCSLTSLFPSSKTSVCLEPNLGTSRRRVDTLEVVQRSGDTRSSQFIPITVIDGDGVVQQHPSLVPFSTCRGTDRRVLESETPPRIMIIQNTRDTVVTPVPSKKKRHRGIGVGTDVVRGGTHHTCTCEHCPMRV